VARAEVTAERRLESVIILCPAVPQTTALKDVQSGEYESTRPECDVRKTVDDC
jgi:hypothetical protein